MRLYGVLIVGILILVTAGCGQQESCNLKVTLKSLNGGELYAPVPQKDSSWLFELKEDNARMIIVMSNGKKIDTTIYGGELPDAKKGDYDRMKIERLGGDSLVYFRILGKVDSTLTDYVFEHRITKGSYQGFLNGDTIALKPTPNGYKTFGDEMGRMMVHNLLQVTLPGSLTSDISENFMEEQVLLSKKGLHILFKTTQPDFVHITAKLKPEYCY